MKDERKIDELFSNVVEVGIRLGFLLLLIIWCLQILRPFASILLWGIILALALYPLYGGLKKRMNGKLAIAVILVIGLGIIIVPSWLFLDSAIEGARELSARIEEGTLTIPKPKEKVAEWPLIGEKVYEVWHQASDNLDSFTSRYSEQIKNVSMTLIGGILSAGGSIVKFILSLIIAVALIMFSGAEDFGRRFFRRLIGTRGDEFSDLAAGTVHNVTKGVLGVALIQSFLVGLGLLFAGVPFAGLWTLLVLVFAILQLPAGIIIIPVVIWLFSVMGTLPAVLWSLYLLVASLSDNVLKPILLGKGAAVPMLVIFLGVIGGFMFSGFIGLFTGAIVISLGYKLLIAWMGDKDESINKEQSVSNG